MDKIATILQKLELFIPSFNEAIDDKSRKYQLASLRDQITNLYKSCQTTQPVSNDQIFKQVSCQNDIITTVEKLKELLSFDVMDANYLLSETSVKQLNKDLILLVKLLDVDFEIPRLDISISDAVKLYKKYPNTINLLISNINVESNNKNSLLLVEHLKYQYNKNLIDDQPHVQKNLYMNLIQRYSKYEDTNFIPFKEIIKTSLGVNTTKFDNIHSIVKSKGSILVIKRTTNVLYSTHKILDGYINTKAGVSPTFIDQMATINRCNYKNENSLILYTASKPINVLELRNKDVKYEELSDMILNTVLIIESIDGINWRRVYIDTQHLLHLLCGPNPRVIYENTEMEKSIMEHWTGAQSLHFTDINPPISHIRQRIKVQLMKYFKDQKISSADDLSNYIKDEKLIMMFNNEMFTAFSDYANQNDVKNIVKQEALVSYLSDVTIRNKRFKRELVSLYNKNRKSLSYGSHILYNEVEKFIEDALYNTITEMDNIFNTLDEKRVLFR